MLIYWRVSQKKQQFRSLPVLSFQSESFATQHLWQLIVAWVAHKGDRCWQLQRDELKYMLLLMEGILNNHRLDGAKTLQIMG